jgi:ABC-type glycerol-3-phosphate transport system substrate-binding protein
MVVRMRTRRLGRTVLAASLAVALAGLAACSSSSSGSGDKSLTYWSMWKVGEPAQKVMATAIADFQKETGIKVNVQWQGRTNVDKLVPALNTRKVPDLVDQSYIKLYSVLVASSQVRGLPDAYADKVDGATAVSGLVPARYTKNIDITLDGGERWMVPYLLTSDGIWYDKSQHPDIASNPPKTWTEFITLLDKLKAAGGPAPIALDGDITGYNPYWFNTLMERILGPGSWMKVVSDKSGDAWDDPGVLDAAKKVEQLAKGHYFINGYGASKWPAQQQAWASHKASLLFMGSWAPTETGTYAAKGFQYASFPFPATASGRMSARADFIGFAVPKKAKNSSAAQQLAAFLLSKKYQQAFGAEAKQLPVRSDVTVAPDLADVQKALNSAPETYQQNDGVAFPGYNEKVFWPVDDDLVLGKISAEEFVHKLKDATVEYWKQQS